MRFSIYIVFTFLLGVNSNSVATLPHLLESAKNKAYKPALVAQKASEFYTTVNNSGQWRYPKKDEPLSTESKYWEIVKKKFTKDIYVPRLKQTRHVRLLKERVSLQDTVQDLMRCTSVLECNMVNLLSMVYSAPHFAQNVAIEIGQDGDLTLDSQFFDSFISVVDPQLSDGQVPLGSFAYIVNVPEYKQLHPKGYARGFNVVCMDHNQDGNPLYLGFDPDQTLFSRPRTYTEVREFLYKEFLKPLEGDDSDGLQKIQKHYKNSKSSFERKLHKDQKKYQILMITYPNK